MASATVVISIIKLKVNSVLQYCPKFIYFSYAGDAYEVGKKTMKSPRGKTLSCAPNWMLLGNTCGKINVKKIAFGNKEHTTDKKMGVSVLLRLFISSNEVCNTAYAL